MPQVELKTDILPPRRRSRRLNSNVPDFESQENTKGLATLPDELYVEIISHLPTVPENPLGVEREPSSDADLRTAHRELLVTLSQMCHNMRRVFRPNIWKRIEVFPGMRIGHTVARGWGEATGKLALEVLRQLEIVTIRDPSLAKDVQ